MQAQFSYQAVSWNELSQVSIVNELLMRVPGVIPLRPAVAYKPEQDLSAGAERTHHSDPVQQMLKGVFFAAVFVGELREAPAVLYSRRQNQAMISCFLWPGDDPSGSCWDTTSLLAALIQLVQLQPDSSVLPDAFVFPTALSIHEATPPSW